MLFFLFIFFTYFWNKYVKKKIITLRLFGEWFFALYEAELQKDFADGSLIIYHPLLLESETPMMTFVMEYNHS